jgi:hypothetical protein
MPETRKRVSAVILNLEWQYNSGFMSGRSPSDDEVRIHLVISNSHKANQEKCLCADYMNTTVPTVTSVMHDAGYAVGHFGKW